MDQYSVLCGSFFFLVFDIKVDDLCEYVGPDRRAHPEVMHELHGVPTVEFGEKIKRPNLFP